MSEWQTIDSAPKDGSEVLLFAFDVSSPYWMSLNVEHRAPYPADSGRVVGRFYDGEWVSHCGERGWEDSIVQVYLHPTHWMPLPDAPAQPDTGKE